MKSFSEQDLLNKFEGRHHCYLSGRPVDLTNGSTYELDHVLPYTRGGANTLDNCELIHPDINSLKLNRTNEELFALMKEILEFNGYVVAKIDAPTGNRTPVPQGLSLKPSPRNERTYQRTIISS